MKSAIYTGALRANGGVIRRADNPALFDFMIGCFVLVGLFVGLCLSGYFMELLKLTI